METEHRGKLYTKKALPDVVFRRLLDRARDRIYARFEGIFPPDPSRRILNLGVNGDHDDPRKHFLESRYPHRSMITAAGLEPPDLFRQCYPEVRYVQVGREAGLPFDDGEFDLVFCNAVIEHVGTREVQRAFLADLLRVGRSAFVTTPNRWYPVELHTMLPFAHYLPAPVYRSLYRKLGFDFFAREENLNMLDHRSFAGLVPPGYDAEIEGVHFLGFLSNLLLIVRG